MSKNKEISITGSTLDELLEKCLKWPGYKAAYDALEDKFNIIPVLLVNARGSHKTDTEVEG